VVKVNDEVELWGYERRRRPPAGVECFRKLWMRAGWGPSGVLLRGTKRKEVERGKVLCKPGSIHAHEV